MPTSEELPKFAAVMVTHRRPELLAAHLDMISGSSVAPEFVIVVDNSPADTGDHVFDRSDIPILRIECEDNSGPAGGFDRGINEALGVSSTWEWVLLLDDDDPPRTRTVIADLLAVAREAAPLIGGVGLAGGVLRRWGTLRSTLQYDRAVVACDYLSGGYLPLYRRAALEAGSPFDSELFFGFEELDAGQTVKSRGFELVASTGVARMHGYGGDRPTDRTASRLRDYYSTRNFLLVIARHRPLLIPAVLVRQVAGVLRARSQMSRRAVWSVRRVAWWHAVRGRAGELRDPSVLG